MTSKLPQRPKERSDDLRGLEFADTADLVLFMAGNQFMVMEALRAEFQKQFPEVNKIHYLTSKIKKIEIAFIVVAKKTFRYSNGFFYNHLYHPELFYKKRYK